jgi:diguanylate cyclase (GGDEF)-like protein/PAS domain S-box-containing protein
MDCAANGIVITDTQGVIQWVNPAVSRMTGYASRELVGEHTRILKSGEHDPAFYEDLWTTISAGKTWHGEITNIRKDGSMYREEQHISPVHGDDDAITHYIAIKQDVTARRAAEREALDAHAELALKLKEIEDLHQQLREEAIRDPLTGLFNRRYMVETMAREMSRARREHINLAVLAIDLDHFKDVNDTLGHAAGDEVLVLLADILQGTIRQSDIACRLGGDEFLMVMPQMPLAMAEKRAGAWQTLFQERQRALRGSDRGPICTLSIGVAAIRADERSVDALLKRADDALYAAKRQGRSCAVTVE